MPIVASTKSQLEEFKESLIWKDMSREIRMLEKAATIEYDSVGESKKENGVEISPSTGEILIHIGDIKGRKKAAAYFLNILDILISEVEVQEDDS